VTVCKHAGNDRSMPCLAGGGFMRRSGSESLGRWAVMAGRNVVSGVELPGDNDSYLRWTAMHAGGYVINIQRSLNASDARLHRASCHWINGVPPRGDGFVGSYIKVCSDSLVDLSAWVTERVRSTIRPCGTCRPALLGATTVGVPARTPHDGRLQGGASATGEALASATVGYLAAYQEPVYVPREGAVTEAEADHLVEACGPLPVRRWEYEEHDYMTNVLVTVLDLQMNNVTVERSIRHYRQRDAVYRRSPMSAADSVRRARPGENRRAQVPVDGASNVRPQVAISCLT
jgi:hypothetical protein